MIISKPLVGECLQCVKNTTSEVGKNVFTALWFALILTVKKMWLGMCNKYP